MLFLSELFDSGANSFLASGDFRCLDPDRDRQNVGPDLAPNHLIVFPLVKVQNFQNPEL